MCKYFFRHVIKSKVDKEIQIIIYEHPLFLPKEITVNYIVFFESEINNTYFFLMCTKIAVYMNSKYHALIPIFLVLVFIENVRFKFKFLWNKGMYTPYSVVVISRPNLAC